MSAAASGAEKSGCGAPSHGGRLVRRSPVAGDAAAQNGRRDQYPRYVACDWRLLPLSWMRSVRQADTALRSMSDLEMACKPSSGKGCAFTEVAGIPELWSANGRKQSLAGRNRRAKPNSQSLWRGGSNFALYRHNSFKTERQEAM